MIYVESTVGLTIGVIDIERKVSISEKLSIINPTEVEMFDFWRNVLINVETKLNIANDIASKEKCREACLTVKRNNKVFQSGNFEIYI